MIEVEANKLTLLESAAFVVAGLGETRIKITSPSESLTFVLTFMEDPTSPPPQIEWESHPPDLMRIKLTNWNTPFPATLTEPTKVGSFNKRELYVLLSVAKLGSMNQVRQVIFTTYLGEAVPDGAA